MSFQQITTNDTSIGLTSLQPGSLYKVFVIAQNENGTSLPSSVLFINTTSDTGIYNILYILINLA